MLRLVDTQKPGEILDDEGLLSYIEMHLTQEQIDVVRQKLKDVLDHLQSLDDPESEPDEEDIRKFRLTMTLYPLDRFD